MIRSFPLRRKTGGWKAIRRDALRELWSEVVRTRDGWACRRCPRRKEFGDRIEAAHILGAGPYPQLKYLVENGIALCSKCHNWFDTHKGSGHDGEADNWVKSMVGIDRYIRLLVLAKTMRRPGKTETRIGLRDELQGLKDLKG